MKAKVHVEIDVPMRRRSGELAWVVVTNTDRALVISDPERALDSRERVAEFKNALSIALSDLNSQIAALPLDTIPR